MTVVSQYVKQVLQLSLLIGRHYVTLKALLSFILIIASFECCKDLTLGEMPLMHLEEFFHQLFLHCSDAYELLNVVALIIYVTLHLWDPIVFPACVLIIISLVFSHIATAHWPIFINELVFKLSEKAVISDTEGLNRAGSLRNGNGRADMCDGGHFCDFRLISLLGYVG